MCNRQINVSVYFYCILYYIHYRKLDLCTIAILRILHQNICASIQIRILYAENIVVHYFIVGFVFYFMRYSTKKKIEN